MSKRFSFLLMLVFAIALVLAACSDDSSGNANGNNSDKNNNNTNAEENENNIEEEADDSGPQDGGTAVYALDTEPEGIFQSSFYGVATDAEVLDFIENSLVQYDDELKPQPELASWETDDDQHFTFTFEEGVKWHNGEELTADDWIFTLEVLADPDYTGPRYSNVENIEGAPAYKEGDADEISGINKVGDYEVEITFDEPRVNNLENLWTNVMPKSVFKDIPMEEMEESEYVRQNPVGTGPFKVENVIPGESVELTAFEDYWKGEPHLDKVIIKVISPEVVVGELENGDLDMTKFHPTNYDEIDSLSNVEPILAPGLSYYYIGLRLGSWDGEKNVDDYHKYDNKKLRQAMAHALDREAWIEEYFNGLGEVVNRPVPSSHWISADDSELDHTYEYDPDKAEDMLDDAGYVDSNDDGWREDPDGEKFVVKFGHYATQNPTFETRAKAITQYWEDVGLKTELSMEDSGLYYDQLEKGDESVETFFGGWSTGSDPDPSALWKSNALLNYPRWVNEENDQLLEDALDLDEVGSGDDQEENRKEIYTQWQRLVNEELPMIPIAELTENYALNENLEGVDIDVSGINDPSEWWVDRD